MELEVNPLAVEVKKIVDDFDGYVFKETNQSGFVIYPRYTPYGSFISGTILQKIASIEGIVFVSVVLFDGRMLATFSYE